jgi:proteasome lid subunit RPN8/RPN11
MKDKIKEECMKNPTEESCGLLLFEKKRTKIIPCQNYAENKKQNFKISFKDFISAEKKGEVFGIYHSHVDDSYEFSEKDIIHSTEIMLPYFLYSIKSDRHNLLIPASSKYKSKSFKNFLSRVRKVYGVK